MENPYAIFPEELWLIIIKQLDMLEVQSIFQALPQFFTTMRTNFGISHFTNESDNVFKRKRTAVKIDTTRLISHSWCTALKHFVDNCGSGQPKSEFRFLVKLDDTYPTVCIKDVTYIRPSFYTNRNLRSVHFSCSPSTPLPQAFSAFRVCVQFLKEYGSRIKVLRLDFPFVPVSFFEKYLYTCHLPMECLEGLKNVHTLYARFLYIEYYRDPIPRLPGAPNHFPELPCLKTLEGFEIKKDDWTSRNSVLGYFLRGYVFKGRVKNLRVISRQKFFTCEEDFQFDRRSITCTKLDEFRNYARWHSLKRITIKSNRRLFVISILWWLQKEGMNPSEICFDKCKKLMTVSYEQIPILPQIKYLKITDATFLEYRFLSGLTSLEHLHVECDKEEHVNMFVYKLSDDCLTNIIRCYLYNDTVGPEVDIWKEMPALQTFVMQEKGGTCRHFIRTLKNKPVTFTK